MSDSVPVPASVRVPREAYRYWPTTDEVAKGKGKKLVRWIFENQELNEYETEKLKKLTKKISNGELGDLTIPEDWSTNHILRFCYGGGWNTKKSLKNLIDHLNWRSNTIPYGHKTLYPKVFSLLVISIQNSGAFYIHGRDERYRPLLIMNITKFDFKSVNLI